MPMAAFSCGQITNSGTFCPVARAFAQASMTGG